ncbi:MAG: hypothetical protein CM15mV22_2500 [Eurybiavirus sp.]|nr:MAG: hypothetical protein CM15mV22_2500 [Eurybiavirus sp.]
MMFIEDGRTPVWQDHLDHPPLEYKHFGNVIGLRSSDLMIAAYPEHELTEWLKRGFAMNGGDSTISFSSLQGHRYYSGISIILMRKMRRVMSNVW